MSLTSTLPTAICSRALTPEPSDGGDVFAEIGVPEQVATGDWRCGFWIRGIDTAPEFAFGVDALQALALAIEGLRAALERSGSVYTWKGGDHADHGVPPIVPTSFGRDFCTRVARFIEQEISSLPPRG